jgi:hypothetical protein
MKMKIIYVILACLLAACSANPATDTPATKSFTGPEKDWQAKIDATNEAAKDYIKYCFADWDENWSERAPLPRDYFTNQEDVLIKGAPFYVMDSVSFWSISKEEELASMLTLQTDCAQYFYVSQGALITQTLSINPSLYGKTTSPNRLNNCTICPPSHAQAPKFIQAIESGCPIITISVHTNKQVREGGGARLYFYYDQGHWKECGTDKSFMEGLEFYRQMARDLFHY